MKQKRILSFSILFWVVMLFVFIGQPVVKANGGISLKPIIHELQDEDTQSWFNLDTSKHRGKTITLEVEMTNTAKDERSILLEGTNVITVQNGGLDFVDETETTYTGMLGKGTKMKGNISGLPKRVTLKGGETEVVPFDVIVPEGEGQFLAGITYIDDDGKAGDAEVDGASEEGSIQVKQQLRFATTLLLTSTNEPKKELDVNSVKVEIERSYPRILFDVRNDNSMMESANLEYEVKSKDTGQVAFQGETSDFLMAPYTYIEYPVSWSGDITSGEYVVNLKVNQKMDDGEYKTFEKELEVEVQEEEVAEITETDDMKIVYKEAELPEWVKYSIFGLGGMMLLIIILLFKRRNGNVKKDVDLSDVKRRRGKETYEQKETDDKKDVFKNFDSDEFFDDDIEEIKK